MLEGKLPRPARTRARLTEKNPPSAPDPAPRVRPRPPPGSLPRAHHPPTGRVLQQPALPPPDGREPGPVPDPGHRRAVRPGDSDGRDLERGHTDAAGVGGEEGGGDQRSGERARGATGGGREWERGGGGLGWGARCEGGWAGYDQARAGGCGRQAVLDYWEMRCGSAPESRLDWNPKIETAVDE